MGLPIFIRKSVGLRIFMEEHVGPSVFMGESVGLHMNTWGPWGSRCSWRNVGGGSPPYGFNNIFEGFPGPPRSAKPQENTPKKEARLPSSIWPPGLNCLTGVSKSPGIPAPSNSHCPRAGLGDERQIATSTLNNHINVVRFWAGLRPKFVPDRFQRTRFRKCYTDQRRLLRETDSKAPGQESEIRP